MPVQEDEGLLDEPDSPIVHGTPPWHPTGMLQPPAPWHAPAATGGLIQPSKRVPLFPTSRWKKHLKPAGRWVFCGLCSCTLLAVLLVSSRATDRRPTLLPASPPAVPFVTARGGKLYRGERVRRFMGANLWYAVHLGCSGCDRARLRRELDALRAVGVSNVRITALQHGRLSAPPWQCPSSPPLRIVRARLAAPGSSALPVSAPAPGFPANRRRCSSEPPPTSPIPLRLNYLGAERGPGRRAVARAAYAAAGAGAVRAAPGRGSRLHSAAARAARC